LSDAACGPSDVLGVVVDELPFVVVFLLLVDLDR